MKHIHSGKVRDIYEDGDDLLLVASDRISVYDVSLPTPIPGKGALLTQLSVWWFETLRDVVPNHLISATDVPPEFARRAIRVKRLTMAPVECVVRGYLVGSGWKDYQRTGIVSGVKLPAGLREGDKLPEPIFTPSTKAALGDHDEAITFDQVVGLVGQETAEQLRDLSLRIYETGAVRAAKNGIIIADTKFEFGHDADGVLTLGDEVLTSDSSRFWPADKWQPGQGQPSFDKQFVRDWSLSTGWDKTEPGPDVPADVVETTRRLYTDVYERITEIKWQG
jgi:phosphoribosylaminoimidazole-succinocarboxamide synthase